MSITYAEYPNGDRLHPEIKISDRNPQGAMVTLPVVKLDFGASQVPEDLQFALTDKIADAVRTFYVEDWRK